MSPLTRSRVCRVRRLNVPQRPRLRDQCVVDSFRGPVFEDLRLTVLLRQLFERLHDRVPATEEAPAARRSRSGKD